MSESSPISIPSVSFVRNEYGLLNHVPYVFMPDGKVNWRKMVSPQYIVPNLEKTKETDISKLEDKDLLILLAGMKQVASLRGYYDIQHNIVSAKRDFVSVETRISWMPNFETGLNAVSYTACADAHYDNTKSFARDFLTSIAENRGLVRAVRGFLDIPILGKDEMGFAKNDETVGESADSDTTTPYSTLSNLLNENAIKFESFRAKMIQKEIEGASDWSSLKDVPTTQIFDLIGVVKKLLAERKAKADKEKAKAVS